MSLPQIISDKTQYRLNPLNAILGLARCSLQSKRKMDHALDAMRNGLMHLGKPRINKEVDWFQKAIEDLQNDGNGSTAVGHS